MRAHKSSEKEAFQKNIETRSRGRGHAIARSSVMVELRTELLIRMGGEALAAWPGKRGTGVAEKI
eukprot:2638857-Pleurochrysis_carterae.AAC.1